VGGDSRSEGVYFRCFYTILQCSYMLFVVSTRINVFYFVLYAFTGPGVRRRNRAEIDPAGWAKSSKQKLQETPHSDTKQVLAPSCCQQCSECSGPRPCGSRSGCEFIIFSATTHQLPRCWGSPCTSSERRGSPGGEAGCFFGSGPP